MVAVEDCSGIPNIKAQKFTFVNKNSDYCGSTQIRIDIAI